MKSIMLSVLRKHTVAISIFLALCAMPSLGQSEEPKQSIDPHKVQIHIKHAIELPWGKPGFSIEVSGWLPNEIFSIHAISPSGEKIELVPVASNLLANEEGKMTVDVDYERKGLSQGHWMFLVAGKPGIHIFESDLPKVEAPTASRPKWKLTFGKTNEVK